MQASHLLMPAVIVAIAGAATAQQTDPDGSRGSLAIQTAAAPHGAQRGTSGLCVDHTGADTYTTADMHGIDNGGSLGVISVTIDLVNSAGAYWDFDGGASYGNATDIVVGATNYGGIVTTNASSNAGHPVALTIDFSPALAPGEFLRFGADTDLFVSDPCPGGNFAAAPAITTAIFTDGSVCTIPYTRLSTDVAEGCCGPSGPALSVTGQCPGTMTFTVTGGSGTHALIYGPAGSFTKQGGVCAGTTVDVNPPTLGAVMGNSLTANVPAAGCGLTVQVVDLNSCEVTNSIVL